MVVCRIAPLAGLMKVAEARVALNGKGSCGYLPVADDLVSAVPWDTRQRIPGILANYGYQILAPPKSAACVYLMVWERIPC